MFESQLNGMPYPYSLERHLTSSLTMKYEKEEEEEELNNSQRVDDTA